MDLKFSDITLVNAGKKYNVHKFMLDKIPYFSLMFKSDMKESRENIIECEFHDESFNHFLQSLYSGTMKSILPTQEYIDMLKFFGMNDLIKEYEDELIGRFKSKNYNSKEMDYIIKNRSLRKHITGMIYSESSLGFFICLCITEFKYEGFGHSNDFYTSYNNIINAKNDPKKKEIINDALNIYFRDEIGQLIETGEILNEPLRKGMLMLYDRPVNVDITLSVYGILNNSQLTDTKKRKR